MMLGVANARRPSSRRLAYVLGSAMVLAGIASGGAAQAAVGGSHPALPDPGSARCSVQLAKTSVRLPHHDPSGGTILVKPSSSGCRDLNLYAVGATDNYSGWLQSGGRWKSCGPWIHRTPRTRKLTPLCVGVPAGTRMQVVAQRHPLVSVIVII
ncbi:MAG TPA: hypothetical protein VMU95_17065 [Trebonia sp.]|nr:hypothetical protein [Trebonia sp.]